MEKTVMAGINRALRRAFSYVVGFDPEFFIYVLMFLIGALLALQLFRVPSPYEGVGLLLGRILALVSVLLYLNLMRKDHANQWTKKMSNLLRTNPTWQAPNVLHLQILVDQISAKESIVSPKVVKRGKNASSCDIANRVLNMGSEHLDGVFVLHELAHLIIEPRQGHFHLYHRTLKRIITSSGILSQKQVYECAEQAKVYLPYLN